MFYFDFCHSGVVKVFFFIALFFICIDSGATSIKSDLNAEENVKVAIFKWRDTWEKNNFIDYQENYFGEKFSLGSSWGAERKKKLSIKKKIHISLSDIIIKQINDVYIESIFLQKYESASYSDEVIKRLSWSLIDNHWLIVDEVVLPREKASDNVIASVPVEVISSVKNNVNGRDDSLSKKYFDITLENQKNFRWEVFLSLFFGMVIGCIFTVFFFYKKYAHVSSVVPAVSNDFILKNDIRKIGSLVLTSSKFTEWNFSFKLKPMLK